MDKFLMFIINYLYTLEQDLITDFLNKVNKETNQDFNGLCYLGEIYYSDKLLNSQQKLKLITNKYLSYINSFSQVKETLDTYNQKLSFVKSCLCKIKLSCPKELFIEELFPDVWVNEIFKSYIKGSEKYKEFLSLKEEKEFTEFVTYIIGLKVIMND